MPNEDDTFEEGEMAVPSNLLDLYVQLEDENIPPEAYEKEVRNAETNHESPMGSSPSEES